MKGFILKKYFSRTELIWNGFVLLMTIIVFLLLTGFQISGSLSIEVNDKDFHFSNAQVFLGIWILFWAFYWICLLIKILAGTNKFFKHLSIVLISSITLCLISTTVIVIIYQDAFGKFPFTKVFSVIVLFSGLSVMYFIRSIEIINIGLKSLRQKNAI